MVQFVFVLICLKILDNYGYPGEVVYGCSYDESKMHLTFDDGPFIPETEIVLDILQEYNISATFFLIGRKIDSSTIPLIERMVNDGHTVGSHTWSHPNMIEQSEDEIKSQIDLTTQALEPIIGYKPNLFRAPYGGLNDKTLSYLKSEGYTAFQWNHGNVDWYYKSNGGGNATNAAVMASNARIGGIVTMHDNAQGIDGNTLRNLIQILINDTSYNPPLNIDIDEWRIFKIVSLLECVGREDINDIPDYYVVHVDECDNEGMIQRNIVYWVGSCILIIVIILMGLFGLYIAKRKKAKSHQERIQLIDKTHLVE